MTEDEKMNRLFSIMLKVKWTNSERFRNGILGIIKECDTAEQFEVVDHILSTLRYQTSADLDAAAITSAQFIGNNWALTPDDTNLVGVAERSKTCGSTAYVRAIETHLPRAWGDTIYTPFDSAFRHRKEKKNLVLVDDFIGTGEKLSKKINALRQNPKTADYQIYIVAFAGMEAGAGVVGKLVDGRIYTHVLLNKCLSTVQPPEKAARLAGQMQILETKIFNEPGDYSFGYKQSEAAFFLEAANMPNNNFPILWWDRYADNSQRATLFTRR